MSHSDAVLQRARDDLETGQWRLACHRLRGHLVDVPDCEAARAELVLLYRAAGYPQEAGRWGFLLADGASADELVAFEAGCSARLTSDWTATMMRKAIRWPTELVPSTTVAKTRLDALDARAINERQARERVIAPAWRRWIQTLTAALRGAT